MKPLMELFPAINTLNGYPLTETEIKMLAKHTTYKRVEPGEVVREHGTFTDPKKEGWHLILKG